MDLICFPLRDSGVNVAGVDGFLQYFKIRRLLGFSSIVCV